MTDCLNPTCSHPHDDHLPVCVRCACARFVFPSLNAPVTDCGGGALTREWAIENLTTAEAQYERNPSYANKCRITAYKMLLPLFIEESDAVQ